jgi:hypothetical protein
MTLSIVRNRGHVAEEELAALHSRLWWATSFGNNLGLSQSNQ